MSLLESEYFAATAVHAGALTGDTLPTIGPRRPQGPAGDLGGERRSILPARCSPRHAPNRRGLATELPEIPRHTHDDYGRSREINNQIWTFLHKTQLQEEPKYQRYEVHR